MKLKFILIAAQIILSLSMLQAQAEKDYLKEGDEYHAKFDNFNAVVYYAKAYESSPESYETLSKYTLALNDAGEECLDLKKRDEAKIYIDKAIRHAMLLQKNFPDSALSYTYLALSYGNIAMFTGNKEKIKYADQVRMNSLKAIKLNPNNYFPYIILGIYYREAAKLNWYEKIFAKTFYGGVPEGTFQQSIQMFRKALSIDPQLIIADYQLSKTYRSMGDEKNEVVLLKKILNMPVRNFRDKYAIIKSQNRLEKLAN